MIQKQGPQQGILQAIANRRIAVMLPLGFASGLPLALTGQTLQAWLTEENIAITTIGIFTLVGVPYTLKFLWAPLMDRFVLPWLGRRRGWMALTQFALFAGIATVAFIGPTDWIWVFGVLALAVAFTSASQDVAFDAYRADVLKEPERGFGAGVSVTGYRIAMLVSGGLALIIADHTGWLSTYLLMAAFMMIGVAATLLSPEPTYAPAAPRTLGDAVWGPLGEFFSRSPAVGLLVLIILYKIGDAFAGSLTTAFLLRGVGFSLSQVGLVNKWVGWGATIVGALAGGAFMVRLGLFRSLLIFGLLQAFSNLSFMVLAVVGKSLVMMVVAVVFENFSGGMGTAAFVAFLMSLCDHRYTATQYALLSALAAIGRVFVGPPSGFLVEAVGWVTFFFITFLAALPGLWLLWCLREQVAAAAARNTTAATDAS